MNCIPILGRVNWRPTPHIGTDSELLRVSPFSLTCLLLVFQWTTYSSRSLLKSSKQSHSLPLKSSSFMWSNTCSVAPLSMQLPFRDMLCTTPALSSLLHHPACWYCQPISECMHRAGALGLPGYELVEQPGAAGPCRGAATWTKRRSPCCRSRRPARSRPCPRAT